MILIYYLYKDSELYQKVTIDQQDCKTDLIYFNSKRKSFVKMTLHFDSCKTMSV